MDLIKKDLNHIWHPCSQMKDYEEFDPIVIKSGEGIYLKDIDGKKYIDAISSWWVNLFGHSNKRLNNAIKKQLDEIEHVIFANFTHKPAIKLANRLSKITPEGLEKSFFGSDGSSAVEIALKMAFKAHKIKGNDRNKFIGLSGGYHGETIGSMSLVGKNKYNESFNELMFDSLVARAPDCYRCDLEKESCNAKCFEDMKNKIENNYDDLAAVIFEPICQGAAGMNIYSEKYLKKLEKICKKYDIYMIDDEIAMGFGRTGKMFACEHAGISPDIMTMSKGLTAGYLPMSIVMTTNEIYNLFYNDYNTGKNFLHSHSYSGNPLACAVALESLKIFEENNYIDIINTKSKEFKKIFINCFKGHEFIGDIRTKGMIFALEIVKDKDSKKSFDKNKRIGYKIYKKAIKKGLLMRPMGDILYFMPPYIIKRNEFIEMIKIAKKSIDEFFY